MPEDYNKTLNLPNTDFSMRASLPEKEPAILKRWKEIDLYSAIIKGNEGKPKYVLHDGPPYANGDIHMGTALNKTLKDIIVKYKNLSGFQAPYVPGWDTHGLPIELKAIEKLGKGRAGGSPLEIRQVCLDFAKTCVDAQKEQFKRLGVLGDFDDPYLTYKPAFEAKQIEIFGEMAKKGYIYKGLKPVYWCAHCETAIAEAEIEYAEDPCESVYVKFKVADDKGRLWKLGAEEGKTFFVIWTTTTWTLPGNMAVCLNPDYDYQIVKANGEYYIMAKELVPSCMNEARIDGYEIMSTISGKELEGVICFHPFLDRTSRVILGDHVTGESGTGCVHTAPGHGVEDFEVCANHYPDIEVIVPVDGKGRMTSLAGQFEGLTTHEANHKIAQTLTDSGMMFATEKIIHQYPHCWRCKEEILFRATEQWFCSVEDFRKETLAAIGGVKWIPAWGKDRMTSMVTERSDWCISRQRVWGVPIPAFYCDDCGKYLITEESIKAVADLFRKEGSDAWYIKSAAEILPEGTVCSCGCHSLTKEKDIMDVWFDSGSSHAAVCQERPELAWPADLYLEGVDQFRGWFQSSLLTSVATTGKAPYKAVCMNGWVVDGEGRKQSKSLGNGIEPAEIIREYGADILRLWVASVDYHSDVRISKEILKQLAEVYRKIRNTARYILGNLNGFDPEKDSVPVSEMPELDRWALNQCDKFVQRAMAAYDNFEFHLIFHTAHNFCTIDMSNFYLDVLKDRLYVEGARSAARRSAQTAVYHILVSLTKALAPILSFTCEEICSFLTKDSGGSVFLGGMPPLSGVTFTAEDEAKWEKLIAIRDEVNKALELARNAKAIGKSLEAKVVLHCDSELFAFAKSILSDLPMLLIVSQVEIEKNTSGEFVSAVEGLTITVKQADGRKCERCWTFSESVGEDHEHPTICKRCAGVVRNNF